MQHLPEDLELYLTTELGFLPLPNIRLRWRRWQHLGKWQQEPEFVWIACEWPRSIYALFGHYKKLYTGGTYMPSFNNLFVANGYCKDESLASCCKRLSKEELQRVGTAVAEPVEAVLETPKINYLPTSLRVRYAFPGMAGTGRLYRTEQNELLLHHWGIEPLQTLSSRYDIEAIAHIFVNDTSLQTILETWTIDQIRELDTHVLAAGLSDRIVALRVTIDQKQETLRLLQEIASLQTEIETLDKAIHVAKSAL